MFQIANVPIKSECETCVIWGKGSSDTTIEETEMTNENIERCVQALQSGGERHKYYVYMLCRSTGQPFYVGKGQGRRLWDHEKEANEVFAEINSDNELSDAEKQAKREEVYEKLRIIQDEGDGLKRVIVKWGLGANEAYMCESALINALGLLAKESIVSRLANRVNGHASKIEKSSAGDKKTIARTDENYLQQCAIEQRDIALLGEARVVLININELYEQCLDENGLPNRDMVKDTVRAFWRKEHKHAQAQYVFAMYRQRVVGVFHIVEMKTIAQGRAGNFADYPVYPIRARKMDVLKSKARTLEEAQNILTKAEYDELVADLRSWRPKSEPSRTYKNFQNRIYYNLDEDVPEDVRAYENCMPIRAGRTDFIRLGRAQFGAHVFNF